MTPFLAGRVHCPVASCLLVGLLGILACQSGETDHREPSPDGIPETPTDPWGADPKSDLSRLRYEFRAFDDTLDARLSTSATASGPAFLAETDWAAVWYVMRARGDVEVPAEVSDGLVSGDPTQAKAFGELALKTEVPWVLANASLAGKAYLPGAARSLMADRGVPSNAPFDPPAPASDAVLLFRITMALDARLATLAAERGVPLASVTPDPALLPVATASASLSSEGSFAVLAAYEAAFASLASQPSTPVVTP